MKRIAIAVVGCVALALLLCGTGDRAAAGGKVGKVVNDLPNLNAIFVIHNHTGRTLNYQVQWGNNNWEGVRLPSGEAARHTYPLGSNGRAPIPHIRFDHIGGDGNKVEWKTYHLSFGEAGYAGLGGGDVFRPVDYHFKYAADRRHIDLYKGAR
jgi:hypothetical protein